MQRRKLDIKALLQIMNAAWMIHPDYVSPLAIRAHSVITGQRETMLNTEDDDDDKPIEYAWVVNAEGKRIGSIEDANASGVAVISLEGAVMKYDYCGTPGTQSIAKALQQANENPSISSIVMIIDSPGGSVSGTQELVNVIRSVSKPVVAYADGMMCSAAMWIGSAAQHRIASAETAVIGSIGTMAQWRDFTGAYEKAGIKTHEIYATESTQKNIQFREANGNNDKRESNYEPMVKTWLDPLNNIFTKDIVANMPNVDSSVLNGAHFIASEAITKGLVDEIGSFETAVKKALSLALAQTNTQNPKTSNMKWKNILSKIGITGSVTSVEEIKNGLTDEGVDAVEASLDQQETLQNQVTQLTSERDALQTKVTGHEQTIANLNTKITNLEAQVKQLGSADGKSPSEVVAEKDKSEAVEKKEDPMGMDFQKQLLAQV